MTDLALVEYILFYHCGLNLYYFKFSHLGVERNKQMARRYCNKLIRDITSSYCSISLLIMTTVKLVVNYGTESNVYFKGI